MIINCPNCSTKYNINSDLINVNGRKVKCIKCENIWLVIPKNTEENDENNQINSKTLNPIKKIPEIKTTKTRNYHFFITFVLIIIIILLSAILFKDRITKHYPKSQNLYDKIKFYNFKNISLENIKVSKLNSDGDSFIIIQASIKNNSSIEQKIPNLLISLEDQNNKEQNKKLIRHNFKLKPNELYKFEDITFLIDNNSRRLTLDLVNDFQLFLR